MKKEKISIPYLNKLLKNSRENILEFCPVVDKILEKNSKKFQTPYPASLHFLLEYAKRSKDNLLAVNYLLYNYSLDISLDYPISSILRTCLSDFISLIYVDSNVNRGTYRTDFEKLAGRFMYDHFNYIPLDEEQKERYKDYIKLDNNGKSKSILGKAQTISKMIKHIKLNDNKYYIQACHNWEWYSKFDHFGIFTYHFRNQGIMYNLKMHLYTISHIMYGTGLSLSIADDLVEQFDICTEEVDSLKDINLRYSNFIAKIKSA